MFHPSFYLFIIIADALLILFSVGQFSLWLDLFPSRSLLKVRAERWASMTGSIRVMLASYQLVFFVVSLPYVVSAVSYKM